MKLKQILLKEYSEKLIKTIIDKWKKQDKYLLDSTARESIERFQQIVNSPKLKERAPKYLDTPDLAYKDITRYKTFDDLEATLDSFPPSETQRKAAEKEISDAKISGENELIYNKHNVEIYNSTTFKACIQNTATKTSSDSEPLNFCIGMPRQSNYWTYRGGKNPRSFYFFIDRNQRTSTNNPSSVGFIHVFESEISKNSVWVTSTVDTDIKYGVTLAPNSGYEKFFKDINGIINYISKQPGVTKELIQALTDAKNQNLFKYVPMSDNERELALIAGAHLGEEDFIRLSDRLKQIYIGVKTVPGKRAFDSLSPDLKNEYVNANHLIPLEWLRGNKPLISRYAVQRIRHGEKLPLELFSYITKQSDLDDYWTYIIDNELEQFINFEIIEKYYSNRIPEYLESQKNSQGIDSIYVLEPEAEKYLNSKEAAEYNIFKAVNTLVLRDNSHTNADGTSETYYTPWPLSESRYKTLTPEQQQAVKQLVNYIYKTNTRKDYIGHLFIDVNLAKKLNDSNNKQELPESIKKLIKEMFTKVKGVTGNIPEYEPETEEAPEREIEISPETKPERTRRRTIKLDPDKEPDPKPMAEQSNEEAGSDIMQKILDRYKHDVKTVQLKESIKRYIKKHGIQKNI